MTLYRRGTVTVEAIQASEIIKTAKEDFGTLPEWVQKAFLSASLRIEETHVDVKTTEGWDAANATGREGSAWIIQRQTEHGELYPIPNARFTDPKAGYTRVE